MKKTYEINKDISKKEVVCASYKNKGYEVKPKTTPEGAIKVDSIIFISPSFTDKLLRKKIDKKISRLLLELNTFYDDESSDESGNVRNRLEEAIKLKKALLNQYHSYLDSKYLGLTLKKLQVIIDGLESRNEAYLNKKKQDFYINMMNSMYKNEYVEEEYNSKKGRSR